MNVHKNARLTVAGRKLLVDRIAVIGLMPAAEAALYQPAHSQQMAASASRRLAAPLLLRYRRSRPRAVALQPGRRCCAQRIEQLHRAAHADAPHRCSSSGAACPPSAATLARLGLSSLQSARSGCGPSSATSTTLPARCCTSTPRSSALSRARATASPATGATRSTAPAGTSRLSRPRSSPPPPTSSSRRR